MHMHCLFDTNALIKYYVPLKGSNIVQYLIDKNRKVKANITNVQIAEMIALFHTFRANGILSSDEQVVQATHTFLNDIKTERILRYDFCSEHLLDFAVYKKASSIPAPEAPIELIKRVGSTIKGNKAAADTADIILLLVMREMNLMSNGNVFLVTCDEHVKAIARDLGIKVLDPEHDTLSSLPHGLDVRQDKRAAIALKALCTLDNGTKNLPLTRTIDVSTNGMCLEVKEPLEIARRVTVKLAASDNYYNTQEVEGDVLWSHSNRAGIQTLSPINLEALLN
jgi:hypothetical protein